MLAGSMTNPSIGGALGGVQPASAYAAKQAASMQAQTTAAVPASDAQKGNPSTQHHGLVQPEDCDFMQVLATNPGKGAAAFGGAPLSRAVHRGQGAPGRNLPSVSQIYVQDAQNGSEFRAIAPDRARRVYGLSKSEAVHRGRGQSKKKNDREDQPKSSKILTVPALRAIALDRDALSLGHLGTDDQILDVLVYSEAWMLLTAVVCLACQCILTGLCLVHAALVFASRPQPIISTEAEVEDEESSGFQLLADVLLVLEPYLSAFTLSFAEIGFIGALVRIWHAHDRATTNEAMEAAEATGDEADTHENLEELQVRQEALSQATLAVIVAVCNLSVVVASFAGSANTAQLLYNGRAELPANYTVNSTSEDASQQLLYKGSRAALLVNGTESISVAEALIGGFNEWHPRTSRLLSGLRAGFGLFALIPAILELNLLVTPTLSALTAPSQTGVASVVEEAKALEEQMSHESWSYAPESNRGAITS